MRTCPACGEDTDAGYAEPCTECGFAAAGGNGADTEGAAEIQIGDQPPTPQPPPEGVSKKRPQWARLVIWLIALGALFGISKLGLFEEKPGPDAGDVEDAITQNAADNGVALTVDCPDDANETEVDGSFFCTVTTDDGRTFRIRVTNHEDTFSWPSGRIAGLA